jgi:hypothetical protein
VAQIFIMPTTNIFDEKFLGDGSSSIEIRRVRIK